MWQDSKTLGGQSQETPSEAGGKSLGSRRLLTIHFPTDHGEVARVLAMDQERFCVAVELVGGPDAGRKLDRMEYEDVCKLHR